MQRLVEDLMSLSRIEAEQVQRAARRRSTLPRWSRRSAPTLRAPARDGRATAIVVDRRDERAAGAGDRAQLSQLLHNLIGNALKYGRAGTPVDVALERDGAACVRLTVADQGEGIAPEHLPRLTERFYRVDAGRSRALGGTGLGLAIVKHIVERHRGRLDIRSVVGRGHDGHGLLPRAPEPRRCHQTVTQSHKDAAEPADRRPPGPA